jgi:hypothetical protein
MAPASATDTTAFLKACRSDSSAALLLDVAVVTDTHRAILSALCPCLAFALRNDPQPAIDALTAALEAETKADGKAILAGFPGLAARTEDVLLACFNADVVSGIFSRK